MLAPIARGALLALPPFVPYGKAVTSHAGALVRRLAMKGIWMLHSNIARPKGYWVEKNELTEAETPEVFNSIFPVRHDKNGTPEYSELQVDLAIEEMRCKANREELRRKLAEGSGVAHALQLLLAGRPQGAGKSGSPGMAVPPEEPEKVGVSYVAKILGMSVGTAKNKARLPAEEGGFPRKLIHGKTSERGHYLFVKAEVDAYAARLQEQARRSAEAGAPLKG